MLEVQETLDTCITKASQPTQLPATHTLGKGPSCFIWTELTCLQLFDATGIPEALCLHLGTRRGKLYLDVRLGLRCTEDCTIVP